MTAMSVMSKMASTDRFVVLYQEQTRVDGQDGCEF
jgi:hypothetical protein